MYKKILIVVDEGPVARAALNEGLALARAHGASVVFFHVLPNYIVPISEGVPVAYDTIEQHRKAVSGVATKVLEVAANAAARLGVRAIGAIGSDSDAAECISRAAVSRRCDLIVIGSHGRNAIQRLLLGSVVTRLITLAPVPVLVCKVAGPRRGLLKVAEMVKAPRRQRARVRMAAAN